MNLNAKLNYFINLYLFSIYCLILLLTSQFFFEIETISLEENFFTLYVWFCYSFLYLLPTIIISKLLLLINTRFLSKQQSKVPLLVISSITLLSSTITLLFLYSDYYLFNLYGYHIDSFVINLIKTPGGIESLGVTNSTITTMTVQTVFFITLLIGFFYFLFRLIVVKNKLFFGQKVKTHRVIIIFLFLFAIEEVSHGALVALDQFEIVQASSVFPLNLNTTFNAFVKKMGYQPASSIKKMTHGNVKYPLSPLIYNKVDKPLNIVWLVAESLRWDMLTPEIMPNVWAYSEKNMRFNHHYSGGNRTRMGLFAMFYGLYAPYWYPFEEQRISSPVLDAVMAQDYQLQINTSQSFSYPELNHTVFVNVPKENMQELNKNPDTWMRDEQNITDLIHFIKNRDPERPFFNFMFFEATHAPYEFPESSVIRKDYIKEMNYARLNLTNGIEQIKNRYINAAHYVDKQIGRLLDSIEKQDLSKKTIVIITGDHGEEFMEKGHWGHGHNAVFPEEQIHVPFVLAIPGQASRVIDYTSSHLDIPATILPLIGITSKQSDYSFGHTLLHENRKSFVVGNYNYLSYIDSDYKLTFPYTGKSVFRVDVRKSDDNLVTKTQSILTNEHYKDKLESLFKETNKFICKEC